MALKSGVGWPHFVAMELFSLPVFVDYLEAELRGAHNAHTASGKLRLWNVRTCVQLMAALFGTPMSLVCAGAAGTGVGRVLFPAAGSKQTAVPFLVDRCLDDVILLAALVRCVREVSFLNCSAALHCPFVCVSDVGCAAM